MGLGLRVLRCWSYNFKVLGFGRDEALLNFE